MNTVKITFLANPLKEHKFLIESLNIDLVEQKLVMTWTYLEAEKEEFKTLKELQITHKITKVKRMEIHLAEIAHIKIN